MITFAEAYCSKNYPLHQYELLTGQENLVAQTVYNKLGYVDDNELHLSKRVKRQSNPNLRRCSYVWITYIEFRNTVRDDFVGYILKKHPVKDMNSGNGYNTPSSRKSQEHWDYAQSIAPNIFIGIGKTLGLVEIVLCISLLFLNISAQSTVFAGVAVGIIFLFLGFTKLKQE